MFNSCRYNGIYLVGYNSIKNPFFEYLQKYFREWNVSVFWWKRVHYCNTPEISDLEQGVELSTPSQE